MLFYFITHTILGFFGGCTALIHQTNEIEKPFWLSSGLGQFYFSFTALLTGVSFFGAIIVTIYSYGILWGAATLGELILGTFLARLSPFPIRVLAVIISPIPVIIIMGTLFGFWRI